MALLEAFAVEKLSSKAVWVLEEMGEMGVSSNVCILVELYRSADAESA